MLMTVIFPLDVIIGEQLAEALHSSLILVSVQSYLQECIYILCVSCIRP